MAEFNIDVEISDDDVIEFVASKYDPEDVFPEKELTAWAERNGFEEA